MLVHRSLLCDSEFGATLRSEPPPPAAPARAPLPSENDGGGKKMMAVGRVWIFLMRGGSGQRVLWAARLDGVTDCSSLEERLQNNNQKKQQAEEEWRGTAYL